MTERRRQPSDLGRARVYTPDFLTELFRNPLEPGYADAARRRADGGRSGSGPTARTISLVVLVVVGFLFAVAYRQTMADEPSRSKARAGLVQQITEREQENDRLAERADALRLEVTRQRAAALGDTEAARLRDLEAVTGLGRVRGDGVVVRVADAPDEEDAVTGERGPNLGKILDTDLQNIANALWASGAEAVSINGQRLTATSTIRLAGDAILVDFRPVTSPYEVSAIGPDRMLDRFSGSGAAATMRAVADRYGAAFGTKRADNLVLPAASQPRLRHAELPPAPSPTAGVGSSSTHSPTSTPSGGGR
ncbi:DUF881 domain-containing protein [Plantactinospora sp. GCM10030261]|uniref:DUF881 domain-containing protein n=1 Tax=Plantactinospora sp. GCM10030261 TaxID=3273420 RepID=UPI0036117A6B